MITAAVTLSPENPRSILVAVDGPLKNRRGLNAALAQRLSDLLADHFRGRNSEPNKRGWAKTNFWSQVGRATDVGEIREDGATVVVAEARFRIHLFGGTIKPTGGRKFLTIPLVQEARGISVATYERKTGRELFRIGHARLLFEKRSRGGTSSLIGGGTGRSFRKGTASEVPLKARQQLRAIYALARQARIKADPNALPPMPSIVAALNEEAADFLARELKKGGPAK
jgi:hypothetical protein